MSLANFATNVLFHYSITASRFAILTALSASPFVWGSTSLL